MVKQRHTTLIKASKTHSTQKALIGKYRMPNSLTHNVRLFLEYFTNNQFADKAQGTVDRVMRLSLRRHCNLFKLK